MRISRLQKNIACELEKQLSRTTEEFASQISSLEERIADLISEKVWQTRDSTSKHMEMFRFSQI